MPIERIHLLRGTNLCEYTWFIWMQLWSRIHTGPKNQRLSWWVETRTDACSVAQLLFHLSNLINGINRNYCQILKIGNISINRAALAFSSPDVISESEYLVLESDLFSDVVCFTLTNPFQTLTNANRTKESAKKMKSAKIFADHSDVCRRLFPVHQDSLRIIPEDDAAVGFSSPPPSLSNGWLQRIRWRPSQTLYNRSPVLSQSNQLLYRLTNMATMTYFTQLMMNLRNPRRDILFSKFRIRPNPKANFLS